MGFEQYKKGDTFPIEIHQVVEGDVLEVRVLGTADFSEQNTESIRLYGIDAPELTQKYGVEAKLYLERLTRHGRFWMRVMDIGEDGFIVGDVYRNSPNESLSQDIVRAGWAYWRRNDGDDGIGLQDLEQRAFFNAMGVWQDGGDEIRPWDYRRIVQEEKQDQLDRFDDYNRRRKRSGALKVLGFSIVASIILGFISLELAASFFLIPLIVSIGVMIINRYPSSSNSKRNATWAVWISPVALLFLVGVAVRRPNSQEEWVLFIGALVMVVLMSLIWIFISAAIIGKVAGKLEWDEWKTLDEKNNELAESSERIELEGRQGVTR